MSDETLGSPTPEPQGGFARDPEDWVTGDEPATGAQSQHIDRARCRCRTGGSALVLVQP